MHDLLNQRPVVSVSFQPKRSTVVSSYITLNLQRAIELDETYRELAKTDADFEAIRGDDRFQAVVSSSGSSETN